MRTNLINRLKEEWSNLDPVDPLRGLIADAIDALTQPAQQQEPVAKWWSPSKEQFTAWCERHNMQPSDRDAFNDAATLYQLSFAAPASKPWVGLMDDDLENAMEGCIDKWDIAEAIEAKLREKNA